MENKDDSLANAVEGIEEDLDQFVGTISNHQKKLLHHLTRLYTSLRGPEDALDHTGYSRPFPPPTPKYSKRMSAD